MWGSGGGFNESWAYVRSIRVVEEQMMDRFPATWGSGEVRRRATQPQSDAHK